MTETSNAAREPLRQDQVRIDPWAVLGIAPGSGIEEIDAAQRRLLAKYSSAAASDPWIAQAVAEAYRLAKSSSGVTPAVTPGPRPRTDSQQGVFGTSQVLLPNETLYFVLVNVLDIFLTHLLLAMGAIEANPLAAYFIDMWGKWGMIGFKLFLVAVVCVVTQAIARRRPAYAKAVLWAGIVIVGLVVIYSAKLLTGGYV